MRRSQTGQNSRRSEWNRLRVLAMATANGEGCVLNEYVVELKHAQLFICYQLCLKTLSGEYP